MKSSLVQFQEELENWKNGSVDFKKIISTCEELISQYQNENDEENANLARIYKEIAHAHLLYIEAFKKMKDRFYYQAWCDLEKVELTLKIVKDNFHDFDDRYGLLFLEFTVSNFQKLFPYKVFFSARYIIKSIVCSICGEKRILGRSCGHKAGKLYNGELCYDIISDFEIITFDAVRNPVNKYAVPFMENEYIAGLKDHYNYSYLELTLRLLSSPYDEWDLKIEKFYKKPSHEIAPTDPCPCMQSLKTYSECCMSKPGIECLHLSVGVPLSPKEMAEKIKADGPLKHFSAICPTENG